MRIRDYVCAALLAWFGFCAGGQRASAQVLYGSVVGSISDQSGAVIPGAAVRIIDQSEGQVRATSTNDEGAFSIPSVLPGTYQVEVTAKGFRTYRRSAVAVSINTVSRIDVQLELGQVGETVMVTAQAASLQADKADVHVELSSRTITQLPLPGYRNFQTLVNLVPGATPAAYQNAVIGSPGRALATNINGTTNANNNTRLDGASNMRASLPWQILYVPPAESIESVNIATNNFDADQGFAGGAAISIATKSGSNDVHGVLFEHHSDSAMYAKNFFYPAGQRTPKNIINIFGGTLGGPIRHDKLFFFGSYEGMRERTNSSGLYTIPTDAQRAGDFSAFGTVLYDPLTGKPDGSGRTPFAGMTIPQQRQSAAAQKLESLIPEPNRPGAVSNYFASAPSVFNRDNYDLKLNWNQSAKTTLWGKYSAMNATIYSQPALGAAGGEGLINGGGTGEGYVLAQVATVGGVHVFSPTLLVDGTLSYSRDPLEQRGHDFGKNYGLDVLGIPGTNGPDPRQSGMPMFNVSGYAALGQVYSWSPKFVANQYWTYTGNLSWTKGAHELRFGADLTHNSVDEWHPEQGFGPRGGFNFTGGPTSLKGGASPNQYNAWAQFLLGLPTDMGKSVQTYDSTGKMWLEGFYIRDRWQVSRKLTVTLGTRWEYYPLLARDSSGLERYDPTTNKVYIGGLGSVPRNAGMSTSKRLLAPRFGLAYRLDQKSVVRAGYGISIDPFQMISALLFPFPVTIYPDFVGPNSLAPFGSLASGIPQVAPPDLSTGILDLPSSVGTVTLENGLYHRGYIQSFNLMLERELPGGFILSTGYVGTRTVRQPITRDINAAAPGAGNSGRPYAVAYGRTTGTTLLAPAASAHYDSLQANLDRRLSSGLLMKVAYTWSKAIDMTDGSGGGLLFNEASVFSRNRALADFDRTQNLRVAFVADLPFGSGHRWASGSRLARGILGGWQASGIVSAYSGTPFTVTASGASLNAPGNTQTADQVKPSVAKLGGIGPNVPFFDPLAFAPVTAVRYGNTGRNILRGPGTFNTDATLSRTFRVSERWKLQFRAESYNVTNTPSFNNPSANASNMKVSNGVVTSLGNFLSVTSARSRSGSIEGGERAFRLALRVSF